MCVAIEFRFEDVKPSGSRLEKEVTEQESLAYELQQTQTVPEMREYGNPFRHEYKEWDYPICQHKDVATACNM